jgi:hypothetical protein
MHILKTFLISAATAAVASSLLLVTRSARSQTTPKTSAVEQELIRTETGFFEAWKTKDETYFRNHIPANGVFWGEYGTFSRQQQLDEQKAAAKACTVDGYSLSDFGVLSLADGAYLLTYKADQYASCGGEKVPVHMNGSSVYVFREGRWQAIYRAEIPLKSQQ